MKNINLREESAKVRNYAPPVCEEINVCTENVICDSGTEKVGETDGDW